VLDYYSNPAAVIDHAANFKHNVHLIVTSPGPFFALTLLVVWIAGVILRLVQHTKLAVEEWIALVFAVCILGAFTRLYGDARYLFPIQVLSILFAPYSAYHILQIVPLKTARIRTFIFSAGIGLLSLAGLYQLGFHSYIADSYRSTATADLKSYFSNVPPTTTVFFYNATNVVPFFTGRNYYQHIAMFEKWQLGSDFGAVVRATMPDMLVLNQLSKADEKVDISSYTHVAQFSDIQVYIRKK